MMPAMLQKDERPVAEEIALMGFWAGQVKPLGDLVAAHSWMSCRAECGAGRFRQKGSKPLLLNRTTQAAAALTSHTASTQTNPKAVPLNALTP